MMPQNGWLVIAFETNNPGAWLTHCKTVLQSLLESMLTFLSGHIVSNGSVHLPFCFIFEVAATTLAAG